MIKNNNIIRKKINGKTIIKDLFIVIIFCTCISTITPIFERKSGAFTKINNMLTEDSDSIEILFIGSSITECSVDISFIEESTGCKAYNLGIKGQPAAFLPLDLQQVLKKQKPKIVFVETYRYVISGPMSVDTASNALGHVGTFGERLDIIKHIDLTTSNFDKIELIFPILAAHNRWSQLSRDDLFFNFKSGMIDKNKGYLPLEGEEVQESNIEWTVESTPISSYAQNDLENLIKVAELNDIELIFIDYPNAGYSKEDIMKVNGIHKYLDLKGIKYLEANTDSDIIGEMDSALDYNDKFHPNIHGAIKISNYIANYINKYALTEAQ